MTFFQNPPISTASWIALPGSTTQQGEDNDRMCSSDGTQRRSGASAATIVEGREDLADGIICSVQGYSFKHQQLCAREQVRGKDQENRDSGQQHCYLAARLEKNEAVAHTWPFSPGLPRRLWLGFGLQHDR